MSATTTVLYTDLAQSSRLVTEAGADSYAASFTAHVALLRTEVEQRGGKIAKLLGDGVLALFDSAYLGVSAAIALQQAVERAHRRDPVSLHGMRIGISVGELVDADDDKFGEALIVGRRLCDAADPGQILVSEVVRMLVGSRTDVAFEPLGETVLKGVAEPVGVYIVPWAPLGDLAAFTVMVADDAPLIRSGVVRLLVDGGFVVRADVADADALVAAVDAEPPDLVVTDIRMPPTNTDEGLRAARVIRERHPDVAVLVLSQHIEGRAAADLLDGRPAGIGYVLKERVSDLADFVTTCRAVAAGASVIDPDVGAELLRRRQHDLGMGRLTVREREVLGLMAEGRSNPAIAAELLLGVKTVETHVRAIFMKLDLDETPDGNRRVQAVLRWLQTGES